MSALSNVIRLQRYIISRKKCFSWKVLPGIHSRRILNEKGFDSNRIWSLIFFYFLNRPRRCTVSCGWEFKSDWRTQSGRNMKWIIKFPASRMCARFMLMVFLVARWWLCVYVPFSSRWASFFTAIGAQPLKTRRVWCMADVRSQRSDWFGSEIAICKKRARPSWRRERKARELKIQSAEVECIMVSLTHHVVFLFSLNSFYYLSSKHKSSLSFIGCSRLCDCKQFYELTEIYVRSKNGDASLKFLQQRNYYACIITIRTRGRRNYVDEESINSAPHFCHICMWVGHEKRLEARDNKSRSRGGSKRGQTFILRLRRLECFCDNSQKFIFAVHKLESKFVQLSLIFHERR